MQCEALLLERRDVRKIRMAIRLCPYRVPCGGIPVCYPGRRSRAIAEKGKGKDYRNEGHTVFHTIALMVRRTKLGKRRGIVG